MVTAQVLLVSVHRTDLHRRLGILGVGLALAMVVTGVLASLDALKPVRSAANSTGWLRPGERCPFTESPTAKWPGFPDALSMNAQLEAKK